MELTNHPFRKENDLNQTSMSMVHVNLQGCIPSNIIEWTETKEGSSPYIGPDGTCMDQVDIDAYIHFP